MRWITEVPVLQADAAEAGRKLGWEPKARFLELARVTLAADLEAAGVPLPTGPKEYWGNRRAGCLTRP